LICFFSGLTTYLTHTGRQETPLCHARNFRMTNEIQIFHIKIIKLNSNFTLVHAVITLTLVRLMAKNNQSAEGTEFVWVSECQKRESCEIINQFVFV
jgi:hypothetical protein